MADVNINFNLKYSSSKTQTPIILVLRWKGNRLKVSIGETINPKFWFTPNKDEHGQNTSSRIASNWSCLNYKSQLTLINTSVTNACNSNIGCSVIRTKVSQVSYECT